MERTFPKGKSFLLEADWNNLWTEKELQKVNEMEERGIIIPFQTANGEIKAYSEGMLKFCNICLEKNVTPNDIAEFNIISGIAPNQTPILDKVALRNFLLNRNTQTSVEETTTSLDIRDVVEEEISEVPEDQILNNTDSLELVDTESSDNTTISDTDISNNTEENNSTSMRSRSEEQTISEILNLDVETFTNIFNEMRSNFTYNGVEYGRCSTKQKANLMSQGTLPKFKNFRVATEEEINLFLIASAGTYDLPEGIIDLIKERCANRSKRTTGKWRSKKEELAATENVETATIPEETIPLEENNVTESENIEEIMRNNVETLKTEIFEKLQNADVETLRNILSLL